MPNDGENSSDSRWVRVVSNDGWSFILTRDAALSSGVFRRSLTGDFAEASKNTCMIPARAAVAEKVVEYLTFKDAYKSAGPKDDIPDFMERLPPELALELLVAADYLEV